LLVFDTKREWGAYPGIIACDTRRAALELLRDGGPRLRVAYAPGPALRDDFDWWADCSLQWGISAPCVVVAEELASVTSAGKAPRAWGHLVRTGLGEGITIYALTQSPSESDKTTVRNASRLHVGRLGYRPDIDYLADLLWVERAELAALSPLQFIERDANGVILRGRLT